MNLKSSPRHKFNDIEEVFRQNPLFSCLNENDMAEVGKHIKFHDIKEGDVLFNRGDSMHSFFFVVEGLIKLYRLSQSGQEKIIELGRPGHIFAEALMFFDHPCYPVSAVAMERSVVVAVNSRNFLKILENSTMACFNVMGNLSHRLHELINEIDHLSLRTGRNRVAMYFLDESLKKGIEFKLQIPKNAIASMLSLQPETFSRLIKELSVNKAIQIHESHIKVLDQNKLRKFAGIL